MKPKIKRIKRSVDSRIYDVLRELHGSYKAERKYKYIQLKHEMLTLNR